jgi:hypothetical protein
MELFESYQEKMDNQAGETLTLHVNVNVPK